jgi:hypothetical protein
MNYDAFDVNRMGLHVVSSCVTNTGPIVFISVRSDHARERECTDPLFSPIPALELEEGLPRARARRRRKTIFGLVAAQY